jgi:hypothetical protein
VRLGQELAAVRDNVDNLSPRVLGRQKKREERGMFGGSRDECAQSFG